MPIEYHWDYKEVDLKKSYKKIINMYESNENVVMLKIKINY